MLQRHSLSPEMASFKLVSILLLGMTLINIISAGLIDQEETEDEFLPARPLYVNISKIQIFSYNYYFIFQGRYSNPVDLFNHFQVSPFAYVFKRNQGKALGDKRPKFAATRGR